MLIDENARDSNIYHLRKSRRLVGACVVAIAVTACAGSPEPLTVGAKRNVIEDDRRILFDDVERINGPLTVYDAIARTLKYNLEKRSAAMEEAIVRGELEIANLALLPEIAASAGYVGRSNTAASSSRSVSSGQESLEASTSQDRNRVTTQLSVTWNILDFGVGYYQAKHTADQKLVAHEARRRTIHNIVEEVQDAYWRLAVAKKMAAEVRQFQALAEKALEQSRTIVSAQLNSKVDELFYQRALIEVIQDLESLQQSAELAEAELGALIHVRPGTTLVLADSLVGDAAIPVTILDVGSLEQVALFNRPELASEIYSGRMAAHEVRAEILRMLPGIELSADYNGDNNSFLLNQTWFGWGSAVVANLMDLVKGPVNIDIAEQRVAVAETRRRAMHMAILMQVHVAVAQFSNSVHNHKRAEELASVDADLKRIFEERSFANAASLHELNRAVARELFSRMKVYNAVSDSLCAFGRVITTLGVDPFPSSLESDDVATIAQAIKQRFENAYQGHWDQILPAIGDAPTVDRQIDQKTAGRQLTIGGEKPTNSTPVFV